MSKPISDAQIYMLLWAESCTYGAFSELHSPPHCIELPGRRVIRLLRTACDRPGLLGLGRRGLMRNTNHGLWEITDAGRAELKRAAITKRIAAMVAATEADDRATQAEHDAIRLDNEPGQRAPRVRRS